LTLELVIVHCGDPWFENEMLQVSGLFKTGRQAVSPFMDKLRQPFASDAITGERRHGRHEEV
jgi:hypothetical protein